MKTPGNFIRVFVFFAAFYMVFTETAYAYLDPGTTSYIARLLIGALVGTICAVRLFWSKIGIIIKKIFFREK